MPVRFLSLQDVRALLLIYQSSPPTEYDPYVVGTLTTLKTLCMEFKKKIHVQLTEASIVLPETAAADEDNQKVPDVAKERKDADHQTPTKKRKLAVQHSPTLGESSVKGWLAVIGHI